MKGVVLNEKDILNDILKNDYIDQKRPISCLRILSKYYLNKESKQEEVINKLNEYMKKNYEGYSEDNWYGKLKGIVKKTQKYNNYNIINVNKVTITEDEWNKIIELNDKHLERVAFILLVYQKINEIKNPKSNGWINQNLSDIFSEANVRLIKEEKVTILHTLFKKEYISQKNSCDATGLLINYRNKSSKDKIIVNNFINVISYYYEYRNNEKWQECTECGKRFKIKSKTYKSKKCVNCRKIINKNKTRERMKNSRKLKNV